MGVFRNDIAATDFFLKNFSWNWAWRFEINIQLLIVELAFRVLKHGRLKKGGVIYAPDTTGFGVIVKFGYESDVVYAGHDKLNIYYLAFSKRNVPQASVNAFNGELIRLYKNGTMKEIYSLYTGNIKARVHLKKYMTIDMND